MVDEAAEVEERRKNEIGDNVHVTDLASTTNQHSTTTMILRPLFHLSVACTSCIALSIKPAAQKLALDVNHANLRAVQQPLSGKAPHPLVLWHGLGDSAHVRLSHLCYLSESYYMGLFSSLLE